MRSSVWSRILLTPCVAAWIGGFAVASPAADAAVSHRVHPTSAVTIADVHCTVGLLLHQGKTVYAAVPASCGALPLNEGVPQWGCGPKGNRQPAASAPVGTPVRIAGAKRRAILVYDSFTRMQAIGVKNNNECQFNDLILLQLKKADAHSARATIPGATAPRTVSRRTPAPGTPLRLRGSGATAAAGTHNGWVVPLSKAPVVTQPDVGAPLIHGSTLVGMLTALPQGAVMKTPPAAYNLSRAITIARHSPGFHHLKLLKAGQHV